MDTTYISSCCQLNTLYSFLRIDLQWLEFHYISVVRISAQLVLPLYYYAWVRHQKHEAAIMSTRLIWIIRIHTLSSST